MKEVVVDILRVTEGEKMLAILDNNNLGIWRVDKQLDLLFRIGDRIYRI